MAAPSDGQHHLGGAGRGLVLDSRAGRMAVGATVAGTAVAQITATVVNVALPEIALGLDADTQDVQWILNSYSLALASLILIGGALGDRFGRRRVYVIGTVLFGLTSLASAVAPTLGTLLAARAVMGVAGAMLTPGSLALLEASFAKEDRSAAIGSWSGLGAVAGAVGPLLGGLLLDVGGWRILFGLNIPFCIVAVTLSLRFLPESVDPDAIRNPIDWWGTLTGALGLAGVTYGLTGLGDGVDPADAAVGLAGIGLLAVFIAIERRVAGPVLPLDLFANRTFSVANLLTFVVYAALGGVFFLLVVFLRQVLGYSGVEAGAATLPITGMMLLLSARVGRLATRIGPRIPLTVGPLLLAGGMVAFGALGPGSTYLTGVLPAMLLFGGGIVCLVAPVTSTVLAAADDRRAGVASGINNAVARTAGLLAVAVLPVAAGLGPEAFADPQLFSEGFTRAMGLSAGLAVLGAIAAAVGLESTLHLDLGRRHPDEAEVHEHPHAEIGCTPPARRLPARR